MTVKEKAAKLGRAEPHGSDQTVAQINIEKYMADQAEQNTNNKDMETVGDQAEQQCKVDQAEQQAIVRDQAEQQYTSGQTKQGLHHHLEEM